MFQSVPILLGQYRPLDSFLHRLDARSKLIPVVLVMVLGVLSHSTLFYLTLLSLLIVALMSSGVGVKTLVRSLAPLMLLVSVTFIYHILFTDRQSEALFEVIGFTVTGGGVAKATFFSLRLLLFVAMAFLVTLTCSPSEIAEAIVKLLRPLSRIGLPVEELGLILFVAIRFIPVLYSEFITIYNAQVIRGVEFGGSILNRIRKITAIIVPVLVGAIGRADDLALAIEARGYRSGQERSFYSRSRFDTGAWLFVIGSSVVVFLLFYLTGR